MGRAARRSGWIGWPHPARAIGAGGHPRQGRVDLVQVRPRLLHERVDLAALEGDRRALGVVLVVGIAALARGDERVEVPGERCETGAGLPSLGLEECTRVHLGSVPAGSAGLRSLGMDMLMGEAIGRAGLRDWRKLAQGLHARYVVADFGEAVRFVTAIDEGGDPGGHRPRVRIGAGHVDLEVVSADGVYRDDDTELTGVEWVTQRDVDLARRIEQVAADLGIDADPGAVTEVELGLDVTASAKVAPVWAALLTGDAQSQGRGSPSDEVRDATVRVPNLWFGDLEEGDEGRGPRFHVEVYVAPEEVEGRVAAVLAAGGRVVDDSQAPGLTVIADPEGNRGVLCADVGAAPA